MPGGHKDNQGQATAPGAYSGTTTGYAGSTGTGAATGGTYATTTEGAHEKKGMMEKIKEKLPGGHRPGRRPAPHHGDHRRLRDDDDGGDAREEGLHGKGQGEAPRPALSELPLLPAKFVVSSYYRIKLTKNKASRRSDCTCICVDMCGCLRRRST